MLKISLPVNYKQAFTCLYSSTYNIGNPGLAKIPCKTNWIKTLNMFLPLQGLRNHLCILMSPYQRLL